MEVSGSFRGVPVSLIGSQWCSRGFQGVSVVVHGVSDTFQGSPPSFREFRVRSRSFREVLGSFK